MTYDEYIRNGGVVPQELNNFRMIFDNAEYTVVAPQEVDMLFELRFGDCEMIGDAYEAQGHYYNDHFINGAQAICVSYWSQCPDNDASRDLFGPEDPTDKWRVTIATAERPAAPVGNSYNETVGKNTTRTSEPISYAEKLDMLRRLGVDRYIEAFAPLFYNTHEGVCF